jgi:hypothetical protein
VLEPRSARLHAVSEVDRGFFEPLRVRKRLLREHLPSPSLSVSINTNNRHLISHSYLPMPNWIMPVRTSQSLPLLRPCLTSHFRQVWGRECTSRLAPPDLGFGNPRIISTDPISQAVSCFAISSTTSRTRAAIPQTSLPTLKCHHQPPRQYTLLNEFLAHPLPRFSSCIPHSRFPSPWITSSAAPPWFCHSFLSPDLCAKYKHRTVSCAFSSS